MCTVHMTLSRKTKKLRRLEQLTVNYLACCERNTRKRVVESVLFRAILINEQNNCFPSHSLNRHSGNEICNTIVTNIISVVLVNVVFHWIALKSLVDIYNNFSLSLRSFIIFRFCGKFYYCVKITH